MMPISPSLYGAILSAVSRTARGEFDISDTTRESLENARGHVEDLSDLIGDFRLTEPGSWSRFLGRLMDYSFETKGRFRDPREAREALGFRSFVDLPSFLVDDLVGKMQVRCVLDFDSASMMIGDLGEGVPIAVHMPSEPDIHDGPTLYRHTDLCSRERLIRHVAAAFWRTRDAVMLDQHVNGPVVAPMDLGHHQYHGDRRSHIDEWRSFREAGLRRNVLLQGPPGCGKTTLCFHAARELSERTVVLTPTCFTELSLRNWLTILELLEPEMVIIDDVDRIQNMGRHELQDKLRFFEEGFCEVPYVLFTSNDCSRMPEAMRRPGRIDQIIRFNEPSSAVQRTIVRELAEREGMRVPDEHLDELVGLLDEFSAAHVVEALRRAQVVGWDAYGGEALARDGDQTFLLHRDFDCQSEWLRAHGFRELETEANCVLDHLASHLDRELVYEDDHDKLYRTTLPNGAQICLEERERSRFGRPSIRYRPEIDGLEALSDGIAASFWDGRSAVLMDTVGDRSVTTTLPPVEQPYYGELLECLDRWKRYRAEGLRRNILIQGKPGCGKSTFCQHAARELSDRTLMLTPAFYGTLGCGQWRQLIELLQPEMVIIDDVDRVQGHSLESKLRLFEEEHCDIPFVLFTSNDHTKLPRAMRRPGRIDQVIEVEPPGRNLRWQLIREMAQRVGTEVPEAQLPRLESILEEQSTAHLVEALRRGKVEGWDADPIPGDTTFDAGDEEDSDRARTAWLD